VPACFIGPVTAEAARSAGFEHVLEADDASTEALADLVAIHAGTPPGRPTEVS
jgi:uroporphyrinogen-III synthase